MRGIVHGRGGAVPRLGDPGEVFGAPDLQLAIQCERGARRVGAGVPFAPVGTGDEVHRLGLATRLGVALDPEQCSVGGGHGDDDARIGRVVHQELADHRQGRGQRMGVPHPGQPQGHRRRRSALAVGVDALGQAASPTLGDHRPDRRGVQIGRVDAAGDEEFVDRPQRSRGRPHRHAVTERLRHTHRESRSSNGRLRGPRPQCRTTPRQRSPPMPRRPRSHSKCPRGAHMSTAPLPRAARAGRSNVMSGSVFGPPSARLTA